MPAPRCPLCRTRSDDVQRVGAVPLCARCASGWALHAADERGWRVTEERVRGRLRIAIETGRPTGLEARLVPEAVHHKAIKIVTREIQAGDRAFDDQVFISTRTRRPMKAWIGRDDVRETLMAVIHGDRALSVTAGLLELDAPDPDDAGLVQARAHAAAVALLLPSDG